MEPKDLTHEAWRRYTWNEGTHEIRAPQRLWVGTTTHRVLDSDGVVHCLPAPGERGCVLCWKPKDLSNPVQF